MLNLEIYTVPLYLVAGEIYNTDYHKEHKFSTEEVLRIQDRLSESGIVFYSYIKNQYFFSFDANKFNINSETLNLWKDDIIETPEDLQARFVYNKVVLYKRYVISRIKQSIVEQSLRDIENISKELCIESSINFKNFSLIYDYQKEEWNFKGENQ